MGTDAPMYNLCYFLEFITGIIVNKWLGSECMGLYRKTVSAVRTDLSAVYHYFFRPVRIGILLWADILLHWFTEKKNHIFICFKEDWKADENWIWYIELNIPNGMLK